MRLIYRPSRDSQEVSAKQNLRIFHFLQEHVAGVLATATPGGRPRASVIYYMVDSAFNIRFMTKTGTRKSRNLQNNIHAMFVVFDEASQATVQVEGVATEIKDSDAAHEVFRSALRASLHTSKNGIPPIAKLTAGEYIAYELKPTEVRMAVYSRPEAGSYAELFRKAMLPG